MTALPVATSSLPTFFSVSAVAEAADKRYDREDRRDDNRDRREDRRDDKEDRRDDRRDYRDDRRDDRYDNKRRKLVVVAPRHRNYKNVVVIRPHGHVYWGYGHHHSDADAWKWLSFTAITLKVLDNMNEAAQREHEAAQIKATTAPVGEAITWETADAKGQVVATKQGSSTEGLTCREFQQTVSIGGESEEAYGTACLQADGAWKVVSN